MGCQAATASEVWVPIVKSGQSQEEQGFLWKEHDPPFCGCLFTKKLARRVAEAGALAVRAVPPLSLLAQPRPLSMTGLKDFERPTCSLLGEWERPWWGDGGAEGDFRQELPQQILEGRKSYFSVLNSSQFQSKG